LSNLRQVRPVVEAFPRDFSGTLIDRSGLLSAYIACKHRGILDFFTGGKVILHKDIDRHHILPRAQFAPRDRASADIVANIAFIAGDVNKAISMQGPEVYLKKINREVLESQCVPVDASLWFIDKADEFWSARRELLAKSFNDFLRTSLAGRRQVGGGS
jgi:hypothetical protein